MAGNSPHQFSRRILVCVTGMSPAVVTETLYGICVQQTPAFEPTELVVLTSAKGKRMFEHSFLGSKENVLEQFYQDYPALTRLPEENIRIMAIEDVDGTELEDIVTPEDNSRVGDVAVQIMRELTADDQAAIHVSLAGGRKTMGFYAGYALSLFGRQQDRLSHVLVEPDYEGSRNFYYPTPVPRTVMDRNGDPILDASKAKVMLAEIPFVALRNIAELPIHKYTQLTYRQVVDTANNVNEQRDLSLDFRDRSITLFGFTLDIPKNAAALILWMAWRKKNGFSQAYFNTGDKAPNVTYALEYAQFYTRCFGENGRDTSNLFSAMGLTDEGTVNAANALPGMGSKMLGEAVTRYNSALTAAFGEQIRRNYEVANNGKYGKEALFELVVPEPNLVLVGEPLTLRTLKPSSGVS